MTPALLRFITQRGIEIIPVSHAVGRTEDPWFTGTRTEQVGLYQSCQQERGLVGEQAIQFFMRLGQSLSLNSIKDSQNTVLMGVGRIFYVMISRQLRKNSKTAPENKPCNQPSSLFHGSALILTFT